MRIPKIKNSFKEFEKLVISKNASISQRAEMRMAFIAGVAEARKLLVWAGDSSIKAEIFDDIDRCSKDYQDGKSTIEVYNSNL